MPCFECKDLGMDCPFTAEAETEDELMKKIIEHAKTVHNMKSINAKTKENFRKAIKNPHNWATCIE